jgi:methionyl-tRNA formyltransferase
LQRKQQDHSAATFCKRRTPSESEITTEELATKSAEYLYNKIRMLADPYPNAYIVAADGKKVMITAARIEKDI